MIIIISGVKEAFLKVAQGIIELYNNNLLTSASFSSSYPISATTSPLPPQNEKALADIYLYQTDSIGKPVHIIITIIINFYRYKC